MMGKGSYAPSISFSQNDTKATASSFASHASSTVNVSMAS